MKSFQKSQNDDYLRLVENRPTADLTWVAQALDIMEPYAAKPGQVTVKDIGCQAFQFYRQMKLRFPAWQYYGYDIETTYIDIGLKHYPELKNNYRLADFSTTADPLKTNFSVLSSTLECVDNWLGFLDNLFRSTTDLVCIRAFLGNETKRASVRLDEATEDYPTWQFGFEDIMSKIDKLGWWPVVARDRYTDSLPILKSYGQAKRPLVRTHYWLICTPQK